MANQWFRFKKFTINQDQCAMKVGTDGVILGAWTAVENAKRALDVGTGTGLLALMLAQRNPKLKISAIEIDPSASNQARDNVESSAYGPQISVLSIDFKEYLKSKPGTFDLIICNPPYFHFSKLSADDSRNLARHSRSLLPEDLLAGCSQILSSEGRISIIIPKDQEEELLKIAAMHFLFPFRVLDIFSVPEKPGNRICVELGKEQMEIDRQSIIIEAFGRHKYSAEYIQLTREFYLDL